MKLSSNKKSDEQMIIGNVPPQAVDVEKSIIGSILFNDSDVIYDVVYNLKPSHFYEPRNKLIYEAILELHNNNNDISLLSVENKLRDKSNLDQVDLKYLTEQIKPGAIFSSSSAEYYCQIIKEKSMKRELILLSNNIRQQTSIAGNDIYDILDAIQTQLYHITDDSSQVEHTHTMNDVVDGVIEHIKTIHTKGCSDIIFSQLDIDKLITGFEKSLYYIIAARPSMGKTAFALTIMRNVEEQGYVPAILSLETSERSLGFRLLSAKTKISTKDLKSGKLTDLQLQQVMDDAKDLQSKNMIIDDSLTLSDQQLRTKLRLLKHRYGVSILFLDFLQLIESKAENKRVKIDKVSRSIKIACKDMAMPVIALSQLSRAPENRTGHKRPMLSDLRESGSLEQDADVVMFLYRPEYYGITSYENEDGSKSSTENICEVIVAKNKDGPCGTIKLLFDKEEMTFHNMKYTAYDSTIGTDLNEDEDQPF